MRKAIKAIAELGGVLLALAGLIISMCDTADLDKQLMTLSLGMAMMMTGALVVWIAKGGEEDGEYYA